MVQQQRFQLVKQEAPPAPPPNVIKQEVEDQNDQSIESVTSTPEPRPGSSNNSLVGSANAILMTGISSDEARKIKRRQYQQKRRQQSSGKDLMGQQQQHSSVIGNNSATAQTVAPLLIQGGQQSMGTVSASSSGATTPTGMYPASSKKQLQQQRSRKGSKYEEDYDAFIESTMNHLRTALPPLTIQEPQLGQLSTGAGNVVFGAGDLTPLKKDRPYNPGGLLKGSYGSAILQNTSDYYNTQPFGDAAPIVPQQPAPTVPQTPSGSGQRGFYHQEFGWPTRWDHHHHGDQPPSRSSSSCSMLLDRDRERGDCDTPDTVISSSSPECVMPEQIQRFPALRFIDVDESNSADASRTIRSPEIPIVAPVPIRPSLKVLPDGIENNHQQLAVKQTQSPFGPLSNQLPLRDATNVTVTLTLNASAAEDVTQVLVRLAALLRVPPPSSFQIVERTSSAPPPGGVGNAGSQPQRLGLYRFKNKDGKEGAPVDIQSILNGTAKFCRHCDVVILGTAGKITKKARQFASIRQQDEEEEEDYHFCSSTCFLQFAVATNTTTVPSEAKEANAVVDHLSNNTERRRTVPCNTAASAAAASIVVAAARLSAKPEVLPLAPPKWKGQRYRSWAPNFPPITVKQRASGHHYKKTTENELTEMLYRAAICIRPPADKVLDKRQCLFCLGEGDGVSDGPARLLNYDVDRWVHLNCALWHEEVFEMVNGALMNVDAALKQSLTVTCLHCERPGASVKCFKVRCSSVYHLGCAIKEDCVFLKNKSVYCSQHATKTDKEDQLTTLAVFRRVYINRDENRQVAAVMHHAVESNFLLR